MRCVVYSATYECDIGPHVFPTRKYRLVLEQLLASGVVTRDQVLEPTPIDRASLEYVHTRAYVDDLLALRSTERVLRSELPDQLGGLALTLEGLEARDRLVVNACGRAGVPLVGLTAGGYARRTADTVTAHVNTTRAVLAWRP